LGRDFDKSELYSNKHLRNQFYGNQDRNRAIFDTVVDRSGIEVHLLEKLAHQANNQVVNIFLFVFKYGPITRRQLKLYFPAGTVNRLLPQLEASGILERREYKYWIKRDEPSDYLDDYQI